MLGIVLSKRDYRENDEIIKIFTEKRGKLELLAKGSKNITSKNSYFLEPAVLIDFGFATGKTWDRITKVDEVEYFSEFRTDLKKGLISDYSVKLVDKLTKTNQKGKKIFQILLKWLYCLKSNTFRSAFIDAFVLQLLSEIGFQPTIDIKKDIKGFSIEKGKFITKNSGSDQKIFYANSEDAKILKKLIQLDFSNPKDVNYDSKLHNIIFSFGDYHLENALSDWRKVIKNH